MKAKRIEEIRLNALAYYDVNTSASLADAFVAGAIWADKHPKKTISYTNIKKTTLWKQHSLH
mgnify:CR=1 FL=1